MATFWISFRIAEKTVGGKTYDKRYEDFIDELRTFVSGKVWEKTTSFVVFESHQTIGAIARGLKEKIAPSEDLFLMREMNQKSAVIVGKNDDDDIFDLMGDYLKKL